MSVKYTVRDAVQHIARTIHLSKKIDNGILPYFFIAGAGISVPNIPSAGGIINECKKQVQATMSQGEFQSVVEALEFDDPVVQYSSWMELAFPNKIDRSTFFRRQIKGAGITSANLLLAQILCSRKVASTVLTPNFDDILKQSMDLLGERNVLVAENAMDNLSITPYNQDELQVVHVHGTYRFYDCANLKNEIQAVTAQNGTLSSTQLLRNFLQVQVPIIIGYSGWDGDVIMTCLKERLSYPVPRSYIWVCYSQNDYDNLPEWLRSSDDVIFVLPDTSFEDELQISVGDKLGETAFRHEVTEKQKKANVDAAAFFYKLISNLGIPEPEVFARPAEYYKELSENILPKDQYAWHMRYWAEKMHRATSQTHPVEQAIRSLEGLLESRDFDGIIRQIEFLKNMDYQNSGEDADFVCSILFPKILACDFGSDASSDCYAMCMAMLEFQEKHTEHVKDRAILQTRILQMPCQASQYTNIAKKIHSISEKCEDSTAEELIVWRDIIDLFPPEEQLDELEKLLTVCNLCQNTDLNYKEDIILVTQMAKQDRLLLLEKEAALEEYKQIREQFLSSDMTYVQRIYGLNIAANLAKKWDDAAPELIENALSDMEEIIEFHNSLLGSISKDSYLVNRFHHCILTLLRSSPSVLENIRNFLGRIERILDYLYPEDNKKDVEIREILSLLACYFPTSIVSDQKKIHILREMQNNCHMSASGDGADMFYYSLRSAYDRSPNPDMYRVQFSIGELGGVEISEAIDEYCKGDWSTAESRFLLQLNNPRSEIRSHAATNLAYMVRRGEARNVPYSFYDLVDIAGEDNIILQINVILYAAANRKFSSDEYCERMWQLFCQLTSEDRQNAAQWWQNIEVVGVTEYQQVQLLLKLADSEEELSSVLEQVAMLGSSATDLAHPF